MKLAKVALQAGIPRYFPWQFGVDFEAIGRGGPQDIFDAQLDVRELLRSQDKTERVVISTGMFMSYLFEPSFGVVDLENSEVHALGSLDTAVTLTTPDDIGFLTAEIVFFEPTIRNEIVFLAGKTVTYGEVADKLAAAFGRPFKRLVWTVPFLMEKFESCIQIGGIVRKHKLCRRPLYPPSGSKADSRLRPILSIEDKKADGQQLETENWRLSVRDGALSPVAQRLELGLCRRSQGSQRRTAFG
ncbi:NmrA-like family protein [Novosphingobium sp. PhB55]|uniref:NmrA family NAD(P)-binding protein n=1 Tax=Novosphingobium sp. PhB55 TaxID=2485106 RepID=UPI0010EB8EE4|nr:NmrA family NAD(P)-binding protein [Novosphingobium sp. PhB55]TDW61517.1 NmrA-like family protein [Novosphingobium sp. PhB55]